MENIIETVVDFMDGIWGGIVLVSGFIITILIFFKDSLNTLGSNFIDSMFKKRADKKKFNKQIYDYIKNIGINQELLAHINATDFIAPFQTSQIHPLYFFINDIENKRVQDYTDNKMLELRNLLFTAACEFTDLTATQTFPLSSNPSYNCVAREWRQNAPKRYDNYCSKIKELRTKLFNALNNYLTYGENKYI